MVSRLWRVLVRMLIVCVMPNVPQVDQSVYFCTSMHCFSVFWKSRILFLSIIIGFYAADFGGTYPILI